MILSPICFKRQSLCLLVSELLLKTRNANLGLEQQSLLQSPTVLQCLLPSTPAMPTFRAGSSGGTAGLNTLKYLSADQAWPNKVL